MAFLLLIAHTLIFVAGMALIGQLLVGLFSWRRRGENVIYQLFGVVARPVVRSVRFITPRVVLDQHVPIVAFLICLVAYFAIGFAHRDVCLSDLNQRGCEKWAQTRMP
jgi:uncharacterized protein YggT (Ycf19 family)